METNLPVISADGQSAGNVELNPKWLEAEKGEQAVHESVVAYLAGLRAGTACTKTRTHVRGGGAKPYRQKGTGRARAGSIRSPLWRGGGITFGPQPRSYAKKINRKVQKLALKRAFTERVAEGSVIIVDDVKMEEPKTKKMASYLNSVGAGDNALIVVDDYDTNTLLSVRNMMSVDVVESSALNVYNILLFGKLVFTKAGLEAFGKRLSEEA